MHELGQKPPTSVNQLLDITTNFASGEEAVQAIYGSKAKRAEAAPAEGSKPKNPSKKQKRGKKGKKAKQPRPAPERDNDSDKALTAEPNRKGP